MALNKRNIKEKRDWFRFIKTKKQKKKKKYFIKTKYLNNKTKKSNK